MHSSDHLGQGGVRPDPAPYWSTYKDSVHWELHWG
jgi:hypothetical protein